MCGAFGAAKHNVPCHDILLSCGLSIESIVVFLGCATVSLQFMYFGECHGSFSMENFVRLVVCRLHIDPRFMIQQILIGFHARYLKLCLANLSLIKNKTTESAFNSSIATISLFN